MRKLRLIQSNRRALVSKSLPLFDVLVGQTKLLCLLYLHFRLLNSVVLFLLVIGCSLNLWFSLSSLFLAIWFRFHSLYFTLKSLHLSWRVRAEQLLNYWKSYSKELKRKLDQWKSSMVRANAFCSCSIPWNRCLDRSYNSIDPRHAILVCCFV